MPGSLGHMLTLSLWNVSYMVNTLSNFPADRFAIYAVCNCGHMAAVDTSRLPGSLTIPALRQSLRCGACGERATGIRIIWTAAGGFAYAG